MDLSFFKEIKEKFSKNDTKEFIDELSNYLNTRENNIEVEEGLYQVIEFTGDSMHLQNVDTNIAFEEKNIPNEIKEKISNDFILNYKNGNYSINQELTDKFLDSMVGIKEFRDIKKKFLENSGIKDIPANETFKILSQKEDENSIILYYGENMSNTIEVHNALVPFFINKETILTFNYESGKFEKQN